MSIERTTSVPFSRHASGLISFEKVPSWQSDIEGDIHVFIMLVGESILFSSQFMDKEGFLGRH